MKVQLKEEDKLTGGCSQNVRNMYNDFYKQIDQKYVAGFKQFFTYNPEQDHELMNRYAKGEYGQKFNQIYDQYKDSITGGNCKGGRLDGGCDCNNEEEDVLTGGALDNEKITDDTDFTKASPDEKKTLEECFNVSPEEAINYRNEEMLANRELFGGNTNDTSELQAYQSMRMKHHIQVSDDFISSYLNGGQCYTIDTAPDQDVMNQNRQIMNRYSKRKYRVGGFSDTNVQPLIQDNTLTIPYHQEEIQTTTGSQVPSQPVDNANTNMQEEQTALQQQATNEDIKGGNVQQQETPQQNDISIDSSSISSSYEEDDNGEELFGGNDKNENSDNEGFVFQ